MLANRVAGTTIVTNDDDTVCKVLHKMATSVDVLNHVSDVVFTVNVTQNEDQSYSSDKTVTQIMAASTAGKFIVCKFGVYYLYPSQVSSDLCYFYSDIMASATVCQRTSIAITSASVGVAYINYVMTPPTTSSEPEVA